MSIYKKIILIAGLILVMAMGIRTLTSIRFFSGAYTRVAESRALAMSEILKVQLERLFALGIPLEELVGFDEECRALVKQYDDIKTAMVMDLNGRIVFHSGQSEQNKTKKNTNILEYIAKKEYYPRVIMDKTGNHYDAIIPVKNLQGVPQGFIAVGYSETLSRNIKKIAAGSIAITLISLIVAMILLFLSINFWVNKPLKKLMAAIQGIKKEGINFRGRVEVNSKDEFGVLAVSFNQMIEDLQKVTVSRDTLIKEIAKREQAEEAYKTILHTSIDGFWVTDIQGRFLDVNDAYCRMIGYSRDELLLKMNISDIEVIEKQQETEQRIQKIIRTGGDRFETRHRRKDGTIVDIEASINYKKEEDGRLFVFLRDISERKKAEERQNLLSKDLEGINKLMVGRELRMIELKKEINKLNQELGRQTPYKE